MSTQRFSKKDRRPPRETQSAISERQAEDLKARLFGAHKTNPEATHAMAKVHKASEKSDG